MQCPSCGAILNDGTQFCTSCGAKLNVAPAAPIAPATYESAAPAPVPTPVNNYPQQYGTTAPVMNTPQAQPVNYAGYSQPQPYQPQPYAGGMMADTTPITPIGYIGYMILYSIPIVGIIMVFVNSFSNGSNINVKNFSRAYLILFIVGFIVGIITTIFFGAVFGTIASELEKATR